MKKILYIRIDDTPVPQVLEDDIVEFDCLQINDFCSFVGYAITENLKNNDGTPYYRLIKPVGQLLMYFKTEDAGWFDAIISQWVDILGDILHKGISENESYVIKFPQEYVEWLCQNENEHYSYIGNNLKKNESIITLDTQELIEDVISTLRLKIERYLRTNNNEIDYIVFSNPHIGNGSEVVKRLKDVFGNFSFLKLDQLADIYEYEKYRGREYVDLGLPSGLKWATCNVGASKPSDYGDYYAWGETTPKSSYKKENSKTYRKELEDISGNSTYDAARANWKGSWRMPTKEEIEELWNMCTWTWIETSYNGHNGCMVKGPNGRNIFLPAAGYRLDNLHCDSERTCMYNSSTPMDNDGMTQLYYNFCDKLCGCSSVFVRSCGCTIRPVSD